MKVNIGINPENLAKIAHVLNGILADEFVLYTKTLKAHWNIEGPDFHSKHLFFETQYQALSELTDSFGALRSCHIKKFFGTDAFVRTVA
jgi:starvation-inducible DNA-binding protein